MDVDEVEVEDQQVASVRREIPMTAMKEFFDSVFGTVVEAVTGAGGSVVGPPFGWYHGMPSDTVDVSAGFPVSGLASGTIGDSEVSVEDRPGGRAVVAMHIGPYEGLAESYAAVMDWMQDRELTSRDDMWEEYLTDPSAEPDQSKWQTRLVLPVR